MTRNEYLKLLKRSVSFGKLDLASQERFRDAHGAQMRHYAQIFREEAEIVAQAYGKLQSDTQRILSDFEFQARHDNNARISRVEVAEHKKELSEIEDILKDI
ncbi:hypothetical protein IT413_01440 [Candidatus Peregrinibacteria bacterium]|nr:hypothetical protein [Candidatus Peregrinibacteria bacterium]